MRHGYGVRIFNPISALWNGIHRPTARILKVPINLGVSFDLIQKTLKTRFGWTKNQPLFNSVSHGRSKTFVAGAPQHLNAVLPQTCPDCKQWVHVEDASKPIDKTMLNITSDVGVEWTAFDCDNAKHLITPFFKPLYMGRFYNYG
jgi:hypothetical protein